MATDESNDPARQEAGAGDRGRNRHRQRHRRGVGTPGRGRRPALRTERSGRACHGRRYRRAIGRRAPTIQADLHDGQPRAVGLVDEAADFLGGLDVLVNNSGVTARADFLGRYARTFSIRIFAVNVRSHYFCAQRAATWMMRRGGGSIVNLSSIHSAGSLASYSVYAATKGAVNSLTRVLAIELADRHIRVNAVAPGHVEVERHRAMPDYDPEMMTRFIPVGRVGHPEDIATMVAYSGIGSGGLRHRPDNLRGWRRLGWDRVEATEDRRGLRGSAKAHCRLRGPASQPVHTAPHVSGL